jgi:hypothetical protein
MNIPGVPDYTYFLRQVLDVARSIGISGWFTGLAWAMVSLSFTLALAQFLMGNRLGFQSGLIRTLLAFTLLAVLTRPEGTQLRGELLNAWGNAHRFVAARTVTPIANDFANGMLRIRDATRDLLGSLGLMAIGGVAVGTAAKMGLSGAQKVMEFASELRGKLGGATKGVGPTGAFQRGATLGRQISWGAMLLIIPYTAAMMLSGLMAYFGIALMPLGVGLLALGNNRLLAATFSLYLSGVVLGVVAPMVFAATVRTASHTTLSNIYGQLIQAQNQAQQAAQQLQASTQQMRSAAEQYGDAVRQEPNKSLWQRFTEAVGSGWAAAQQAFGEAWRAVTAPINNILNSLATFIVTGFVSIFIWLISIGALLYGSKKVMDTFAGFRL